MKKLINIDNKFKAVNVYHDNNYWKCWIVLFIKCDLRQMSTVTQ